jgi:nucleoside-diphosphate-sugar epimerase
MDVAIAGGHGSIARRLASLLAARGDRVRGLIRNPNHAAAVHAAGADPIVCDLEHSEVRAIAEAVEGADAVVFAAGAGPGSGTARKLTMDRDGAVKLLDAARAVGTRRYVIISSVGAENPPEGDEPFSVYLQAKAAADAAVAASDRDWTIVRPGRLTDEPGAGRVRLQIDPFRGDVTRDDVAAVLAAVLPEPRANGVTLYVNGGDDPIEQAVDALLTPS